VDDYLTDYFEVVQARFVPPSGAADRNRLSVTLKALRGLTNPPCKVELDFPREKSLFPALLEPPTGTLSGSLLPGKELPLFADDLALDPAAPTEGEFFLNIDGDPRALWFRTNFVRDGGEQRAEPDRKPRLRLEHKYDPSPPPAALAVRFVVDNAPADSRLVARLGRVQDGRIADDVPPWTDTARDRSLGFAARGENGALLFEAEVKDREHVFKVPRIRGERVLEARLLGRDGRKELAPARTITLTLDDQPPEVVSLYAPAKVAKGTLLIPVKGTVVPPASGIKEVVFFVGRRADVEKAREAGVFARGQPGATPGRDWEADLLLPKDVVGPVLVSARFTSGVDLSSFSTVEVTV
ncbi:MAG: hypothetical protein LC745_13575, partial [Planctomycetia bacterium]|nr:hypothetical protein [Planctomycetia bacterium]